MAATEHEQTHEGLTGDPALDAQDPDRYEQPDEQTEQAELPPNRPLSPEEQAETLSWFMEEGETDPDAVPLHRLEIDVSVTGEEQIIPVIVKPLDDQRFDDLRRLCTIAAPGRAQRRQGAAPTIDMARYNAMVVFEAIVEPDLKQVARSKGIAEGWRVVQRRFRFKPLLITQIADAIFEVSGGDEAVRTPRDVRAVKGS